MIPKNHYKSYMSAYSGKILLSGTQIFKCSWSINNKISYMGVI